MLYFSLFSLLSVLVFADGGMWCYKCVSSHPGCGLYDFDWRFYWSHYCHNPDDKCVKLIEEKDGEVMVTRDCLSNLEGHRRDIPADRYEGCRNAEEDVILGQYVIHSVPEIDYKRQHYSKVTFCFCDFDERCNDARANSIGNFLIGASFIFCVIRWM